jgi:hypothetical protein
MLAPKGIKQTLGVDNIVADVPRSKATELGIAGNTSAELIPAFIFQSGEETDRLLSELAPLVASGRVVVQPTRALVSRKEEKNESGTTTWEAHPVDVNSPFDAWRVIEEEEADKRPVPVSYAEAGSHEGAMFEITLPYLTGISFNDLAMIIEDERDLLGQVRSSIKSVVDSAKPDDDINEMARDLVDPEVAKLNRKLTSVQNIHALRMAGVTVGTVALAYTAVSTAGFAGAVAGISGSGGVRWISKQYADYRKERSELEQDPFYFLWRCRQLQK